MPSCASRRVANPNPNSNLNSNLYPNPQPNPNPSPNPSPNPNQARRVGALQTYLRQQEEAFAAILVPPPPRSTRAAVLQVVFVPGYEWRSVPDGAAVPPGLQV